MALACEAAGVTLLVGHGLRRLGAARAVERLVRDGALGQVVLAEANFSLTGTLKPHMWRYRRETCPGGPLLQIGVHHIDTLLHWLGPAARVQGSFARLVTEAEIDDLGIALVEHESGARSVVSSSYVSPKTFSLRLAGHGGRAGLRDGHGRLAARRARGRCDGPQAHDRGGRPGRWVRGPRRPRRGARRARALRPRRGPPGDRCRARAWRRSASSSRRSSRTRAARAEG